MLYVCQSNYHRANTLLQDVNTGLKRATNYELIIEPTANVDGLKILNT